MNDIPKINRVMLIDDDEIEQMLYERVINRSGLIENTISFTYAENALEYLKKPDSEQIDVIFLDINMPRMNGFEFLERAVDELKPHFTKLVVIMLTSSLNPQDKIIADSYSIVKDYVIKPLTPEAIMRVAQLVKYTER